jgi:hypothetical protein
MSENETEEPQPDATPTEPDAEEEVPEQVPDDWLDPKPFDPAGR